MSLSYSHGREFARELRPFLERHDTCELLRYLEKYWPQDELRKIVSCGHDEAVKIGIVCLSLTGRPDDVPSLAEFLDDDDAVTSTIAEHAMWCVWFRSGDSECDMQLRRAVRRIAENDFDAAVEELGALIRRNPNFAEAYNQRAIAYFLKEDYARSIEDCHCTLQHNPYHFGAMAGLGHCHASQGDLQHALEAYCAAMQLHPRLEGIRQSIQQIRSNLSRPSSGAVVPPLPGPAPQPL